MVLAGGILAIFGLILVAAAMVGFAVHTPKEKQDEGIWSFLHFIPFVSEIAMLISAMFSAFQTVVTAYHKAESFERSLTTLFVVGLAITGGGIALYLLG